MAIGGPHGREADRICGQAPSDYPECATWLVGEHIDSIALNPDVAITTALRIAAVEAATVGGEDDRLPLGS